LGSFEEARYRWRSETVLWLLVLVVDLGRFETRSKERRS
jgi:hypothetical protein